MIDAQQYNIRDEVGRLLCPACGFPEFTHEAAYDERGGLAGVALCPCCMWEPGFDDDPHASGKAKETILASLQTYRIEWGKALKWQGRSSECPEGWNGEGQLSRLFQIAPGVR